MYLVSLLFDGRAEISLVTERVHLSLNLIAMGNVGRSCRFTSYSGKCKKEKRDFFAFGCWLLEEREIILYGKVKY